MENQIVILKKMITSLLDEKKYPTLRDMLVTMNPSDLAGVFDELDQGKIPLLFRLLPKELAADTFVEMEPDAQELLIRGFSDSELKEVIDELYVDDAVDIVEEMPANVVRRILRQADPDMRKEINELLRYPENSAGSLMTTEYVSLRPNMTVVEAFLRIRRQGVNKETIYTCYVTENRKLRGLVTVKDLLLADDDEKRISEIMEENVISVKTVDDQEEVAQMFSKYNFLALPVVDAENRMVGIVTFDDAMDVLEDEATEDMELMAGMLPSEHTYLHSSPFEIWKKRIPWLLLLMVSATFTGQIINKFESALAHKAHNTAQLRTGLCILGIGALPQGGVLPQLHIQSQNFLTLLHPGAQSFLGLQIGKALGKGSKILYGLLERPKIRLIPGILKALVNDVQVPTFVHGISPFRVYFSFIVPKSLPFVNRKSSRKIAGAFHSKRQGAKQPCRNKPAGKVRLRWS